MPAIYVMSAAVQSEPHDEGFLASLGVFSMRTGARLLVVPAGPASVTNARSLWPAGIAARIVEENTDLGGDLTLTADRQDYPGSELATKAGAPLARARALILAHPEQMAMAVPGSSVNPARLLVQTGTLTMPTAMRAHRPRGACVLEMRGRHYRLYQVQADPDGSFHALGNRYHPGGHRKVRPEALVLGDPCLELLDAKECASLQEMIAAINPRTVVFPGLEDLEYWTNSEHPLAPWATPRECYDPVLQALKRRFQLVNRLVGCGLKLCFVPTHPRFLRGWLARFVDDFGAPNELFDALDRVRAAERSGNDMNLLEHFAKRYLSGYRRARFLDPGESCQIAGMEIGHGVLGSLRRIAYGSMPGFRDGAYTVGACRQWGAHRPLVATHAVIYPDGNCTLIHDVERQVRFELARGEFGSEKGPCLPDLPLAA